MTTYLGRIQLLAKTATDWQTNDPVLMLGEIGAQDVGSMAPVLKMGDGVRPYSLLPNLMAPVMVANDYVTGSTTTLPPGSDATVTIDNMADPPTISFGIPAGDTGPANTLTIGEVTESAPGGDADASITGTAPNQVLNLVIPRGEQGTQGVPGPANSLTVGEVQTMPPGSGANVIIHGTPPNQFIDFQIPQGDVGPKGDKGDTGAAGNLALGAPTVTVGLVAKAGVAVTAIRSDGAPALDQAITPTWTGAHVFAAAGSGGAPSVRIESSLPLLGFWETDVAADNRRWDFQANGGQFIGRIINDANTVGANWIVVTRNAAAVSNVEFPVAVNFTNEKAVRFQSFGGVAFFDGTAPRAKFVETDAPANGKEWELGVGLNNRFSLSLLDDASAAGGSVFHADRTPGTTQVSRLLFPTMRGQAFCIGGPITALNNRLVNVYADRPGGVAGGAVGVCVSHSDLDPYDAWVAADGSCYFLGCYSGVALTHRGWLMWNGTSLTVAQASDARLKSNIADAADAGAILDAIRVRAFNWTDSGNAVPYGFIAQEVHEVYPYAAVPGDADLSTLRENGDPARPWASAPIELIPLLVKEVQSLRARIAALETH